MARQKWSDVRKLVADRPGAAERLAARRKAALAEIGLYDLRQRAGMTQRDVAAALNITQAAVSKTERSDDVRVSTLRSYLASLGADLQLTARFADGEVAIPITLDPEPGAVDDEPGDPQRSLWSLLTAPLNDAQVSRIRSLVESLTRDNPEGLAEFVEDLRSAVASS
ncbi:MAG TPA: XRE family transcriptional regulator [Acidimicrobiales bacterium]|nr:XRE family transcriptional regulator [Acidimicrobiales bacterium]